MSDENMNIFFSLEEKNTGDNNNDIFGLIEELDNQPYTNRVICDNDEYSYFEEYTVKDLLKICTYYGIDKHIKSAKCKKQDIVFTLVYFESLPENAEIVRQRQESWNCISILLNDPKMKKYILWT